MGRIVITGSSGVVGSAIVSHALATTNHHLVLVDSKPPLVQADSLRVSRVTADLTVYETWRDILEGADALIHLAAFAQPYHATPAVTHDTNVMLSWHALRAAADAGINRVVIAGSINAIGGCYNEETPKFRYFPLDEDHPSLAEDAYSLSKHIAEIQADCIARTNPNMSIATLRFHLVTPIRPSIGHKAGPTRKDIWGWTSSVAAARASLLGLEMKTKGHEMFFVVAPRHCCDGYTASELAKRYYPQTEIRGEMEPNQGFYLCTKAERLLGWTHDGGQEPIGDW